MPKILVVEDDFDIQELLQNFLQAANYKVTIASDGVEALSFFANQQYDLILLDIMLPKIDGFTVCELIRKQSQVPIIMLTALNGEEEQIKGLDLQVDDYITKPFSMPILIRKIAAVLRRSTMIPDQEHQTISYNNLSDCEEALSDFSKETNAVFWVEDQNGSVVYPAGTSTETEIISGDTAITFDDDTPYIDVNSSGKTTTSFYPITLKDGSSYTLAVQVDLFVVQQTTEVLWSIFPYVLLMIFVLSLLCSWIYARYITRPIVRLSKISEQMASLDFSGQCSMEREDELGRLAQNLNSLSTSLSTALNDLHTANDQLNDDGSRPPERTKWIFPDDIKLERC